MCPNIDQPDIAKSPETAPLRLPEAFPTTVGEQYEALQAMLFDAGLPVETATRRLHTEVPRDPVAELLLKAPGVTKAVVDSERQRVDKKPVLLVIQLRSLFILSADRVSAWQLVSAHNTPTKSTGTTEAVSVYRFSYTPDGYIRDGTIPFAQYLGPDSLVERFRTLYAPCTPLNIKEALCASRRSDISKGLAGGCPAELAEPFELMELRTIPLAQ